MGWKDLMKNVTDKATSVAETAQAKFEEQKQLSAIKKEEQNKKMEEMNERVTEYEQELLQNILSGFSGAPCIEVEDNILDFTKDYFEKLLLPANSVSASKITMYPYSDKIQKKAQKALREYDDTETPVFQFEGNKGEFILMTPTKLYIAVAFPENQTFVANVAVDLQQVSQLGFVSTEDGYQVVCNGVELFSADNVSEFDRITIEEYVRRLEEKDFEITETQIDEVIKKKIGDNILRIIRQYVFDDELLIYFAWGMDNITAKDFVVCTNKQILMLDREMLGATKNVKQLYKDLEAYLMVVNDIQMRYVHAKFDDSEDSEFEECAEKLEGIPNEYKKYSKFKAKIKLYKEELQKAISLEKKFRKKYDKLKDPYQEGKVDEYLEIANEWKEEIDKEFPATSEDSYEANLKSYLNDIFLSTLSPYLTATLDSSKLGDGENPYADLQKEQEEREQENTETFTPSGSEGGKPEDVVIYNP